MWNIAIGALGKLKQAQGTLEHIIERASEIYEGCEDCAREKSEAYATLTDLLKAAEGLIQAYNLIDRQIANALNIGEAEERKENVEADKSSFFERVDDFINSNTPDNKAISSERSLMVFARDNKTDWIKGAIYGENEELASLFYGILKNSNRMRFITEIAAQELLNDIKRNEANNTASAAKPS